MFSALPHGHIPTLGPIDRPDFPTKPELNGTRAADAPWTTDLCFINAIFIFLYLSGMIGPLLRLHLLRLEYIGSSD